MSSIVCVPVCMCTCVCVSVCLCGCLSSPQPPSFILQTGRFLLAYQLLGGQAIYMTAVEPVAGATALEIPVTAALQLAAPCQSLRLVHSSALAVCSGNTSVSSPSSVVVPVSVGLRECWCLLACERVAVCWSVRELAILFVCRSRVLSPEISISSNDRQICHFDT